MQLVRELDVQMELGECPLWDHRHNQLYWVDIIRCTLYRLDWVSGEVASWPLPALGGGLGLLGEDDLIVAVQTGLFRFRPVTGAYEFLLHPNPGRPTHRLNEGKTDPQGNFWIGAISTLGRIPECGLFRVTPDGEVSQAVAGVAVPNALVFLGNEVVFADSAQRLVWKYELAPDGKLANRRVFIDDAGLASIPDGAAADSMGRLWNAKFGGGRVVAYDPEGRAAEEIPLPVTQITSCAFCGPKLDHLAVTTAKRLLDAEARRAQGRAGNLFLYKIEADGLKEPVCPEMRSG
jgi:sugar lactone lactonase YvrE